ncbi:MAG: phosphatase PAP2 family protein [Maricaulaceae bacterium]
MVDITSSVFLPKLPKDYSQGVKIVSLLLAIIVTWFSLALILSAVIPDPSKTSLSALPSYLEYASRNGKFVLFLAALISPLIIAHRCGEASVIEYIRKNLQHTPTILVKVGSLSILAIASFGTFMFSYSTIKTRIPEIVPFTWDEIFMKLDRLIFFGNDPWVLFSGLYNSPSILVFMDTIYDIWATILVGTWALCFACYGYAAKTRFQFPLAILITWFIGGNLLAIVFASAGPCYYGAVTGLADPFAAQMAILAGLEIEEPLRAVRYQAILWDVYENPGLGFGGISAMPSMHCATTALLVLFAWKRPILKWLTSALFILIFISSFVLGWHYAVDGLLAIPVAIGGWLLAGKILSRFSPKS